MEKEHYVFTTAHGFWHPIVFHIIFLQRSEQNRGNLRFQEVQGLLVRRNGKSDIDRSPTSKTTSKKTLLMDYWNKNKNVDLGMRKDLGLD